MLITHGIDLVDINRIEFTNPLLVKRILTNNEYTYFNVNKDKIDNQAWIASKWAIKEAFYKATNNKIAFNKIEIIHIDNKPYIMINDEIIKNLDISVSYQNNFVIASVIFINQ